MNTDIQTLKQILNRILRTEPADKTHAALLNKSYVSIKSAVDALEDYQAH
ncbi:MULTISPECIES: hypothetical protein [Cyanophyceae]|nr:MULTISPECIES: hypothetical protein [Cyanophyceae]MBD1914322.1 hypothetical protein [Phormidium sp. FACHB-77]MBD2028458.1 hypothetical protein [Phormidium sp. FACHB-322]MBD2053612.1 hypothetical protein [Leptolyngbya sp. FACHB-60]